MKYKIPLWKEAPFLRLVIPLIGGIIFQYYTDLPLHISVILLLVATAGILIFNFIKPAWRHAVYVVPGILINVSLICTGGILAKIHNPYSSREAVNEFASRKPAAYMVSLQEPLQEKKSSWKALGTIRNIYREGKNFEPAVGILVYFAKDSLPLQIGYGSSILFTKAIQPVRNFNETGSFNYERFCALKNIHFQVFLRKKDVIVLPASEGLAFMQWIYSVQSWIIAHLKANLGGENVTGLALALLIGYKNDLDKHLLQSYSNTGVVHVIAISGLHLGIIYSILKFICQHLNRFIQAPWFSPLVIICGLWAFSILAGASPSVLRSAAMFSFIVAGDFIKGRWFMINNLSASAFFLLCIDPYWLWDLGFILSYTALLSIIIYRKPIYQLIVSRNRIVDAVWKMNAVTLSAQVLTTPVLLYNFQQFPAFFLIANFVAIPLSGIILTGEILMCCTAISEKISGIIGWCVSFLIQFMNNSVIRIDALPFSVINTPAINIVHIAVIYLVIYVISHYLIFRHLK